MASALRRWMFGSNGVNRMCGLLLALLGIWAWAPGVPAAQSPPGSSQAETASASHLLIVRNLAGETKVVSKQEFVALPRVSVRDKVPHSEQAATYDGVLLSHVLQQAGVHVGDQVSAKKKEADRLLRSAYVLIEAADGYQVVFSLAEVFPEAGNRGVILADRIDGKPLDTNAAPYQIVVPGSLRYERWIRQVRRILVQPATASPFSATQMTRSSPSSKSLRRGGVYLVGTGPGSPDLITVRAAEVLREADLVFCFHWMKDELAPFVRPGVVEIASPEFQGGKYFGQKLETFSAAERDRAASARTQWAKLKTRIKGLVDEGKTVVFADNGDPMIFSPWSWVPEQLADLKPVVVPGLSSFNAANAALGRSVAGRGSVTLSSGMDLGTPDEKGRLAGTIVFFTHRANFQSLLPKLRERYPADTPVSIVCDVSYPTERVIHGTLGTILDALGGKSLPHLYLVYVGDSLKQRACCP